MTPRPTIGLEVHAELKTLTKMFCSCKNDPDEIRPNINVCPICLAHPGTLPVINKEAVRHVLRMGTAIGGTLANFSEFDRKSYFYPDIPKGYQISQYEHPLISGGKLSGVEVTRIHLEEDTARSTHVANKSLVDFNRAGIPLMELVTEPVMHDAETAGSFARELQLLLRTLGAGEANLEKGEMRIEANVSVSSEEGKLGTKVEIKNLNSFRSVERAIAYEIDRQSKALEKGEKLVQETRGWNETKQETFHQRFKEGSADYRYFPEPDLPKMVISEIPEFKTEALRTGLPELPWEKRERITGIIGIPDIAASIVASPRASAFFDSVSPFLNTPELNKLAANYLTSDLAGDPGLIDPVDFVKLIRMIDAGELSSRGAKDIIEVMKIMGGSPEIIAKEKGLLQVHDTGILQEAVRKILTAHADVVADYKAGKDAALQFLVGQAMRETRRAGNPELLRQIIISEISK